MDHWISREKGLSQKKKIKNIIVQTKQAISSDQVNLRETNRTKENTNLRCCSSQHSNQSERHNTGGSTVSRAH